MTRNPLTAGERRLLWLTGLFLALVGGLVGYLIWLNLDPVVPVPAPVDPSPNARETYLAASKLLVNPSGGLAIDRIMTDIRGGKIASAPKGVTPPTLAQMRSVMAKNAPVIARLRTGFTQDYRATPIRSWKNISPENARNRELARLLQAAGDVACAGGQWDAGVDYYLDAIRLGVDLPRGGGILPALVGNAVQQIGREELWTAVDHLSAPAARRAARRLEEIGRRPVPFADVQQEALWSTQASLQDAFRQPRWREQLWQGIDIPRPLLYLVSKRAVMEEITRYHTAWIAYAKQPYATRGTPPAQPGNFLTRGLYFEYLQLETRYRNNGLWNDLLAVQCALRAYRLEHGAYPATLAALVPGYLQAIPDDPFALKAPLQYRGGGHTYTLYSIGPDGADDGGTPSPDGHPAVPGATMKPRDFLRPNSTGDIVAGMNVR